MIWLTTENKRRSDKGHFRLDHEYPLTLIFKFMFPHKDLKGKKRKYAPGRRQLRRCVSVRLPWFPLSIPHCEIWLIYFFNKPLIITNWMIYIFGRVNYFWCLKWIYRILIFVQPSRLRWLCFFLHVIVINYHYNDVIMSAMASQITSLSIVYSTVYSGAYQRKHQTSASLAFVWGIHRWPVNSPQKGQ